MSERGATQLPTGTATFVFTDIEGSTKLLQQLGPAYTDLLETHRGLLRAAFTAHHGHEMGTEGDAFFVVFEKAADAVAACVEGQRALAGYEWPENASIRVRIGIHAGEATVVGDDYVGIDVHRAARIGAAAHGGQVIISESVRALVERSLPPGVALRDMGEHRLKDLARPEHLYQLDIEALRNEFPAIRTLEKTPNNLPLQLTTFVGREKELAEAAALLARTRVLTLTGPGGTGKSRLALQIAAESSDGFPDGIYFVRLAPISDARLVASTIAQTLGLQEGQGDVEERLFEYLRGRRVLLLLDNFEQLLEAAPLVGRLAAECRDLKVLTTSRAPLRIYGEQEFQVPPLGLPDVSHADPESLSQYDAVRLFLERATASKPDFRLTAENAAAVAAICVRLDGLPLAIELAAARIRLLSPQAMLPRLERALEVLSVGSRDLPARQQTLRGAIAWSYDLLEESSRQVFSAFSVFRGGANLSEAEKVCVRDEEGRFTLLDTLQTLVEHSVLRQSDSGDEPRFWMLVTIREYGAEQLREQGREAEMRDRHAATYADIAHEAADKYTGPEQRYWLDRVELDIDNIRIALDWLIEKCDGPRAMRMGAALWRFWQMRGHLDEGRRRLEQILTLPCPSEDVDARADALEAAGGIAYWQGNQPVAKRYYGEAVEASRQVGDERRLANALYNFAFPDTVLPGGDPYEGLKRLEEAEEIYRRLGDRAGMARSVWGRGNGYFWLGEIDRSESEYSDALGLFRELDDSFGLGWAHRMHGLARLRQGALNDAKKDFEAAMKIFARVGDTSGIVLLLDDFARLARISGEPERGLRLEGARATLQAQTGTDLADRISDRLPPRPTLDLLPADEARRLYDEGARMDVNEAVALALGGNVSSAAST